MKITEIVERIDGFMQQVHPEHDDDEDLVLNTLTDIRHFCSHHDIDFDFVVEKSFRYQEADINEGEG